MSMTQGGFGLKKRNADDPLNGLWRLKAGEKVFGPYTGHQLCQFRTEGRLAAHSLVARDGASLLEAQWHTASTDTVLGALFRTQAQAQPVFGQKGDPDGSKFVIYIDLKGGHSPELEVAISSLGRAQRITPALWLVSGSHTVGGLRNHLSQYLGPLDWMLVIDASQGRTGGFNMGPEMDAQIRRVWRDANA